MATYVIGDIQGCYDSLQALVDRIEFRPGRDRLWVVGDLVNRGPKSLEVLRWARGLGDAFVAVLGNHDLHLLARSRGWAKRKRLDTLDPVLAAPDASELIDWLWGLPLFFRQGEYVMVHAGLLPGWTLGKAEALAREAERALRGDKAEALFAACRGGGPAWSKNLEGVERAAAIVSALVRVRTCTAKGELCHGFTGPAERSPPGCRPWYARRDPEADNATILFGHWSALGLHIEDRYICLDSGCVWGGELTALRLEDGRIFRQRAID